MGHNVNKFASLAIRGGGGGWTGWRSIIRLGPILFPSYPLTYINLHIKYGSNPFSIFLSYRIHEEMRWRSDD